MLRAFERIHCWPAQVGAEFLKKSGVGEQLILERATHRLKLGVKIVVKEYVPSHGQIMALKAYYFKVVKIQCAPTDDIFAQIRQAGLRGKLLNLEKAVVRRLNRLKPIKQGVAKNI